MAEKGKMHRKLQALTQRHSITQRNIRSANTCDPVLKLLNEEITSAIQKHKQNIWKEHLHTHWAATQQTLPHTFTTTDIKRNMHHIHTSIVFMHLATRGNNKMLCTPPPHISSSEERLPRLTRRTFAQLRTNILPSFTIVYLYFQCKD